MATRRKVVVSVEQKLEAIGRLDTREAMQKIIPSRQNCFLVVTQLIILCFVSGSLYGILGNDVLPGSEIFALFLLGLAAYAGGILASALKLPPLLGMLIVGILYRNLSFLPYYKNISIMWASTFKDTALVIILLKAGLGLDSEKLMKLKLAVLKLSCLPCLIEAAGSAIATHFLLGLPWLWAWMLGFIISAVSAAVLVPGVLALEDKQYGVQKGIPTLILAAVSIDNIITLTGFFVTFSIITSNENLQWSLIKHLLEPCVGFVVGAVLGLLLWYLPHEKIQKASLVCYRVMLLCFGGLALSFISKRTGLSGAGALSCVSLAFVASLKWRKDFEQFRTITWITGLLWQLVEPFLFGLIGAEVTFQSLQNDLGFSVLAFFLGVVVRVLATIFALFGSKLSLKEKIFVSTSWLSKATVQAAVGSQALDYAKAQTEGFQFEVYGKQVLTLSVLSIILTAPLGAAFMDHLGPCLLNKDIANEIASGFRQPIRNSFSRPRNYGSSGQVFETTNSSRRSSVKYPNEP